MPSKTTNKPSAKKAGDAKPTKAAASAKTTAKSAPAEKAKGAEKDAPVPAKAAPKETVSLIDRARGL